MNIKNSLREARLSRSAPLYSHNRYKNRQIQKSKKHYILGDIVISLEKISMEAIEQRKSFWDHLLHMIIHSILHLFGYDHQNDREAFLMEKKEKQIRAKFPQRENFSL